ncbi:MAG: TetR family transcriptional regulator C-terminal domain-containing protein [Inquilinus sp.]|uniref:TetR/AcrR family transcriptional regulator n=1 Tax=Inquilinus sp. TaxID=1932117 RepID=UPI003F3CE6FF
MTSRPAARRGPKPKPGTRDTLVQAGLGIMHAEGYAATGIQAIVEEAGVPKGSFYNHFASKEAFGADVIVAYSERGQTKLRSILTDPARPPLARLEAYFDDRIAAFRASAYVRGCLMGNFSAEAADHSPLIRERLAGHFAAWTGLIEACIAEAQAEGSVGSRFPAPLLAGFVMNSWEGALLRMRVEKSDAPLLAFKQVVFDGLLA